MTWLQRYHVRHYIEHSIWILPVIGMLAAMVCVRLLHWVELAWNWESRLDPDTARAVLGTIASSLFTFVVFVSSALLVAVQLASAQLTPRVIGLVFKDPVHRLALTLFVFTFTFSLGTLVRITTSVPWLTTQVAAYGCVLSLGVFLFMIDHVGKALRPSGALWAVARQGRHVIESVYPQSLADIDAAVTLAAARVPNDEPAATIPSPKEGAVLAFDQAGLLALARQADCVIEMVPQVGDHVSAGDPLFRIFRRPPRSLRRPCVSRSPSGRSALSNRMPRFPFGSWWTSLRRRCHRRSTIRRRRCSRWTRSTNCCASWDSGFWIRAGFAMRQVNCDSSTAPPTGKISCGWPSPKFATFAVRASRLRGACGPCSRI